VSCTLPGSAAKLVPARTAAIAAGRFKDLKTRIGSASILTTGIVNSTALANAPMGPDISQETGARKAGRPCNVIFTNM
jgi:hypothetical protein